MCDCFPSISLPPQYSLRIRNLGLKDCFKLPKYANYGIRDSKWSSITTSSTRFRDAIPFPSDEHQYDEFGLPDKEKYGELPLRRDGKGIKDGPEMEEPASPSGIDEAAEDLSIGEIFKFRGEMTDNELVKEDDAAKPLGLNSKLEESERNQYRGTMSRRQMMRRSNVMAKQVISIHSALSLGFVTQLWVDANSWVVMVVEVKPNLLSGDSDRFLLKEITQVGDVILVEDENVIEDDLKLVGLETLVGYTVVTRRRQSIGKVRGYNFNISSGTVESLELDSFGVSIIPSSLVSTYALLVDDVLEVYSDTVVVRDAAVSRVQRLTKGLLDFRNAGNSNEFEEQSDADEREDYADYSKKGRKGKKLRPKERKPVDDWELPMDYL